jgi:membrane-associated protease RseP (regulator of RpoE activity)
MFEIIALIIGIIGLYAIASFYLKKKGYFEKYNISFYGPALMIRTKKGVGFLRKIARHKHFWNGYGKIAVIVCFIMMIVMVSLVIFNAWSILEFTPEQKKALPGIKFGLILPGINPLLPLDYLFYIIIALIIGIIVHEFSHGILTFAHGLKVKSLGLLYLIVPLGAFCEPDEEELKETSKKKRMHVYAAGPMSNFVVALITLLLFSYVGMAAVEPIDGFHVMSVYDNSPADLASLEQGSIITMLNGSDVKNREDLKQIFNKTKPNQTVSISYYFSGKSYNKEVELTNYYDYLIENNEYEMVIGHIENRTEKERINETLRNETFFGITEGIVFGVQIINIPDIIHYLQNPLTNVNGLLFLYSLPLIGYFIGYNPLISPYTQGLEITGIASFIPSPVFWIALNIIFWVFWLNLLLGFFNVLPMVPLDGGFLFTDSIRFFIQRIKTNLSEEHVERVVRQVTTFISLIILFLVLFPWFVKYF